MSATQSATTSRVLEGQSINLVATSCVGAIVCPFDLFLVEHRSIETGTTNRKRVAYLIWDRRDCADNVTRRRTDNQSITVPDVEYSDG